MGWLWGGVAGPTVGDHLGEGSQASLALGALVALGGVTAHPHTAVAVQSG